ncbi:pyruvate kinase, cytosolic isozyme [Tanacetum coccineum]
MLLSTWPNLQQSQQQPQLPHGSGTRAVFLGNPNLKQEFSDTDSAILVVGGWLHKCSYSWPTAVSFKTSLDRSRGEIQSGLVQCRCENIAVLGERKNVNLPRIDMIALSFVRKGSDLVEVRKLLGEHAKNFLMSKPILTHFMVARGDLSLEIPIEMIFLALKVMVYKCNIQGKPVVTATQMLESMIKSPRPTRAEATDVANAVLDGTDCVMLSGETAAGAYPKLAVLTMARICSEAENMINYSDVFKRIAANAPIPMSPLESLASVSVQTANLSRATLILFLTRDGSTAKLVAKGLVPILSARSARASHTESTEEVLEFALQHAKAKGMCKEGDVGVALHRDGTASIIKIVNVK